jgi:hypothetical protein
MTPETLGIWQFVVLKRGKLLVRAHILKEDSMKKGLIFGLIAVLSAAFLVIGCNQATDSSSSGIPTTGERLVDFEATTETQLVTALANPAYQIIGYKGSGTYGSAQTLTTVTEIPAGKTVILFSAVSPKATDGLEVNGTLVVEGAGILKADVDQRVRVPDGYIEVINGTLQVDSVVDIHGRDIQHQILGTGKAYFNGGTLEIVLPLKNLDDVKTAFSWVPKGEVRLMAAPTQAIKPSELTKIQTTATSRLTIGAALKYDALSPDTTDTLTVPVGMTFTTIDPLTAVKTLTVAGALAANTAEFTRVETLAISKSGSLTAPAALFNNVGDFTVSGAITAALASYDRVKTLEVESSFNAGAAVFASLESLKVNPNGSFTTTGSIGSDKADAAGITIVIAPRVTDVDGTLLKPAGSATVGAINKLKSSTIAGSLRATSFTPFDANATLGAAAEGAINGVTFPAPITVKALGYTSPNYSVTIDAYTVRRDDKLDLADNSSLIIASGQILTIEPYGKTSGNGVIIAVGGGGGGTITIESVTDYTTIPGGVKGADLEGALTAFTEDTETLGKADYTLSTPFTATDTDGIGSVAITGITATAIRAENDAAGTGDEIELTVGTVLVPGAIAVGGSAVSNVLIAELELKTAAATTPAADPNLLQLTDSGWVTTTAKTGVLTFTGYKLQHKGLISPTAVPEFKIGVKTARTT